MLKDPQFPDLLHTWIFWVMIGLIALIVIFFIFLMVLVGFAVFLLINAYKRRQRLRRINSYRIKSADEKKPLIDPKEKEKQEEEEKKKEEERFNKKRSNRLHASMPSSISNFKSLSRKLGMEIQKNADLKQRYSETMSIEEE